MHRLPSSLIGVIALLTLTSSRLSAEQLVFSEAISPLQAARGKALKQLIDGLMAEGKVGTLAKSVGPGIGLDEQAPIHFFGLKPNKPHWEQNFCDLVMRPDSTGRPSIPHCLTLIQKRRVGHEVTFTNLKFDLTGRFLAGYVSKGKTDASNKPIRGSAVDTPIDVNDKAARENAEKELGFWLSGNYRKHLDNGAVKVENSKKQ